MTFICLAVCHYFFSKSASAYFDDYIDLLNHFSLSGLPLVALDLSDYIHITDSGVHCIAHMTRYYNYNLVNRQLICALAHRLGENEICIAHTIQYNKVY